MSIDPASTIVGAVAGGVAGDLYGMAKDKAKEATQGEKPQHGTVEERLILELISLIHKEIVEFKAMSCPELPAFPIQLQSVGQGYELNRRKYKHVSLLSTVATTVVCNTPIGPVNFNINVGWNAFDLPDNTVIFLQSGNPTNFMLKLGDEKIEMAGA